MDLSLLDKSSGVTPLLVKLYDSHKLYLSKENQSLARHELTTAISILMDMKLSIRESELVADVMIALVRQAEKDLRVALAERLSTTDRAPLRLILQLSNDEIDVAGPVLRNSVVLSDMDLIYIIKSKGSEHWSEIARRQQLSDNVMNVLVDTRDFSTAMALAENDNIKLNSHTLNVLSELAQNNEQIATPLLHRDGLPGDIAAKLYQSVGQELKNYIVEKFDIDAGLLNNAIDDIIFELSEVAEEDKYTPTAAVTRSVERYKEKGLLTIKMMLSTLKRGQMQTFIAMLANFSSLPSETIISILKQHSGQGLAVLSRALDVSKQDFISFYLLSNRVRSEGKMVDLKDITRAITYYDRITPKIAKDIIQNTMTTLKD